MSKKGECVTYCGEFFRRYIQNTFSLARTVAFLKHLTKVVLLRVVSLMVVLGGFIG